MLTNIHYFKHYVNYMQKTPPTRRSGRSSSVRTLGRVWQTPRPAPVINDPAVLLNKAYKNQVVRYANDLSRSVVGLKDAAKMFVFDGAYANKNYDLTGLEPNWPWLAEDINNFVSSYNSIQSLAQTTNHSPDFLRFSYNIMGYMQGSQHILHSIGVGFASNRGYKESYELEFYNRQVPDIGTAQIDNAMEFFSRAYGFVRDFLSQPLSHHMEFKGLNYYYNYKIGEMEENTFGIIDSGLIVDIAV